MKFKEFVINSNKNKLLKIKSLSIILLTLAFMTIGNIKVSAAVNVTIDQNTVNRPISSRLMVGWNTNPYGFQFFDQVNWQVKDVIKNYMDDMTGQYYRYPGGTVADYFNWKGSIGPYSSRSSMYNGNGQYYTPQLGLDEMARYAIDQVGGKLIYVVRIDQSTSPSDSADLVEYLNTSVGSNPNGGTAWTQTRSNNGHAAPYNVKLFELGNEMDWGDFKYSESTYRTKAKAVMDAMLAVDNTIEFIGHARTAPWSSSWTDDWDNWNIPIMSDIGTYPNVKGMAFHPYYGIAGVDNMFNNYINDLETDMSSRISNGKVYVTEHAVWADDIGPNTSNMQGAAAVSRFLLKSAMDGQVAMATLHEWGRYLNSSRWPSFEIDDTSRPVTESIKVLYNNVLTKDIVNSTGSSSTVQVIGAKDSNVYVVAISNQETTDQTVNVTMPVLTAGIRTVTYKGVKPNGSYETEVNYTTLNQALTVTTGGNFSISVPAMSVEIVFIPK